ncbi:MAG: phenylalanine--tRNA ligase subunit beta [Acidobacteriota bacterium]|nr:phenylalanine--tRNA ligase subunit beta [Acidobacteriota bacterium]MDH3783864.1 phenylalanine--tRNA ligase subunit beta [Acidobacteriota bacterium]
MIASYQWLRALCPTDAGPERVAELLTSRGLTVDSLDAGATDVALEIDIPANRPDCLGHVGLARELAAGLGVERAEEIDPPTADGAPVTDSFAVTIDEPDLCRRYTASLVRNVQVGPSPAWVVERLTTCGLRSINNVVDASNLVLLETGHPIHFFDAATLKGGHVRIRCATDGEPFTTLDDEPRALTANTLMIADDERPLALAGVMGGADSEIGESTEQVLIEAAWFAPSSIRGTARRLGMHTDASHRFERGADPEGVLRAQRLAQRLLGELAGGKPAPGLIDAHPLPHVRPSRTLRESELPRLLGFSPESDHIQSAFAALELDPMPGDEGVWNVTVPSWRVDLEVEADLVEEVARHVGYDNIPTVGDEARPAPPSRSERATEERARDLTSQLGFHEAFGYSMVGQGEDAAWVEPDSPKPMQVENPIADWLSQMRRSILPTLRRAAELNHRRGQTDVRLFEVGRVFLRPDDAAEGDFPHESLRLGLAWSGAARPRHWSRPTDCVTLPELQGLVERLLAGLQPSVKRLPVAGGPSAYQPGRAVTWKDPDGKAVAWAGHIHPDLCDDLPDGILFAELVLDHVGRTETVSYRRISRYPAVHRDLAVVVPADLSYERLLLTVTDVPSPAPVDFNAVDRYQGPPLAAGEASLTLRATLSPEDRTLTDEEIDGYRRAMIDALGRNLGVEIRQGD